MASIAWKTGDYTTDELGLRNGDKVIPVWCPKGGLILKPFPAEFHSMHRLSNVAEISDIAPSFVNEREGFQVGKERRTINDGVAFTATLTIEGNALATKAALLGKDLHTYQSVAEGQSVTASGHMFLISADSVTGIIRHSTVLMDCDVKLTDIPGATDGTSNMSIELTTRSRVLSTTGELMPVREIWYDGTSPKDGTTAIVNAAAPDGTITSFKLGTGNHTGLTDTPLAVAVDEAAAGTAAEYITSFRVNDAISSAFTYASATGILTPSTTLAAETKMEAFYFVRAGALSWDSAKAYGIGEIVSYNSAYYVSAAASTGTTPAGTSPWLAYTGFGVVAAGGSGVATPLIPYLWSSKFDFVRDWNNLMKV